MQMLFRVALSIAAFFVGIDTVAAQPPPPRKELELLLAGYKPLSAAQVISMFVGNTEVAVALAKVGDVAPGEVVAKTFYRDTKVRISVPQGGPKAGKKFEGKWWMEGDFMCGERPVTGTGNSCWLVYEVRSSFYYCEQVGNCNILVRIVPGNPDGI
jgi:hypothetical protein